LGVSKWLPRQYTWSSYTAVACAILVSSAAWHICGDASVHGGCWAEDMLGLARQATLMACGGGRSVPALDSVVGGSRVRAGQTPRDAWAWDTSWDTEPPPRDGARAPIRKSGPGHPGSLRVTPGHSGSLREKPWFSRRKAKVRAARRHEMHCASWVTKCGLVGVQMLHVSANVPL
jgi:hypothetical protein